MNLIIQRIIRQGITAAAGYLAAKGILEVGATESWVTSGVEFLSATVLAAISFGWSSANAWYLKRNAAK